MHHSIYEKVKEALVKAYAKVTIGDPLDQKNLMGPLIDQQAVDSFLRSIDDAKKHGGKVLFGGKAIQREGFFVEPAIIEAKNEWEVVQNEPWAQYYI